MAPMALVSDKPQTLRNIRLNHHISINDLAFEAQVSRHAIIRLEQLCYPSPLPSVITALSAVTGLSEFDLEDAYLADVRLNRVRTGSTVFANRELLDEALAAVSVNSDKHPFQQWRELVYSWQQLNTSRIHFSADISVHPATLDKYEGFKSRFPRPLEVALTQAGLPETVLDYWRRIKELTD